MPSRHELNVRARAVGFDPATIPNDSKLEQKVLYLEKSITTFSGTAGSQTLTSSGVFANDETVTVGNMTYRMVDALADTKATGTLTSDATAPSDADTVTIGETVYTFKTALSAGPAVAYEVLIGASAAAALDNLKLAINAGAGVGTNYSTGTAAHPSVVATTNTDTTQVVEALTAGRSANAIATTEESTHLSWGAATLTGGVTAGANNVLIGASAAASLDNLKAAINGDAGGGTTYAANTPANPLVTATTNTDTTQLVVVRDTNVTNASVATTETSANNAWGAATIASGVAAIVAEPSAGTAGVKATNAGLSGDKNVSV